LISAVRWGQSAYETNADLQREQESLSALGIDLIRVSSADVPPSEVEVMVVNSGVSVDESLIGSLKALRLVVTTTSGSDHVDLHAAQRAKVQVARCPLARRDAVVDTSIAMGLALLRQLPSFQRAAQEGKWVRGELPSRAPRTIRGLPVGVIGAGVIGKQAIRQWEALGAQVSFHDPHVDGSVGLRDLMHQSAIVTLHCDLNPSSRAMINSETLAWMPEGSLLVNTARGACVDLEAVLAARQLGGFALDVFADEPPTQLARLAEGHNVVLTPHAAGFHPAMAEQVCEELVDVLSAWLGGRELPGGLV